MTHSAAPAAHSAGKTAASRKGGSEQAAAKPIETPLARASRVANMVSLDSVRFVQFSGQAHGDTEQLRARELTHRVVFTRPKVRQDGRTIFVNSTFIFSVSPTAPRTENEQAVEPVASLRATVELTYTQTKDDVEIHPDDIREFANVNVPFNSWGYWREFVQSGLGRLGVASTVILPLFRVQTAGTWMIDDEPKG